MPTADFAAILAAGDLTAFGHELIVLLIGGFLAGLVCRKLGVSPLIGYLLVGVVIGDSVLGLVASDQQELTRLAELGVLLLLFNIGLELSIEDLVRLRRPFLLGGSLQMALVIAPMTGLLLLLTVLGGHATDWRAALLMGTALSFSSTVLVFKALTDLGEASTSHGRRGIAVLLFQDVAVVPALLLIPLLADTGGAAGWQDYATLLVVSVLSVPTVLMGRWAVRRGLVSLLADMRSPALLVLFTIAILAGVVYGCSLAGLPASLGAFAAGLMLSGNRLTAQVDALVLPFREVFAAIFFVGLGMLLDVHIVLEAPFATLGGLIVVLALKTGAAALALRATGLPGRAALGMGLGLGQVGEFALVVLTAGVAMGVLAADDAQVVLFIAVATLVLTPLLLGRGLRMAHAAPSLEERAHPETAVVPPGRVVVAGMGLVGRGVADALLAARREVSLVDLSPVNLHEYAAAGVSTVGGDAREQEVLERAGVPTAKLVIVTVPVDAIALRVVAVARALNATCPILLRCRYQGTAQEARRFDVLTIVEETETLDRLLEHVNRVAAD